MIWIPVTLAAATLQILRTSQQHTLRSVLSTNAAGYVRFAFGAPLAILASLTLFVGLGHDLPDIPTRFWPTIVVAGIAQIIATIALLAAFKLRDFAIGTVYSKSEVLIVAGLGAIGIGTALAAPGWIGALLVTAGVGWLASKGSLRSLLQHAGDRAAVLGIIAGGLFGVAAIGIGAAAQALTAAPAFDRALLTLTVMLVIQTIINSAWFVFTDPTEITRSFQAWRPAIRVGVFSMLGSLCWAWALTLESAAKVRTLGQVELIIAFLVARLVLGERHSRADYLASSLVLTGVVLVTLLG